MDDQDVQKIIIVTQTPPAAAVRKHPGGDRTGSFTSRTKITSDLAQAINDGLYFYEQVRLYNYNIYISWVFLESVVYA